MLKSISIYQILGGLVGFFILSTIDLSVLNTNKFIVVFLMFTFYLLCVFSGYMLLKGKLKYGINLSIILNLFQILSFGILGFTYKFVSGICLGMKIDLTEDVLFTLLFDVTNFQVNFWGGSNETFVGLNFIPIIILHFLFKIKESSIN